MKEKRFVFNMGDCLEEARIDDLEEETSYGIDELEPLTVLLNELNDKASYDVYEPLTPLVNEFKKEGN